MVVLKGFHVQVIGRVVLLAVTLAAWLLLLMPGGNAFVSLEIVVAVLILLQVALLIRYVEKTNRELIRFFNAVRHADFSQSFSARNAGASFAELYTSFNEVMDQFRKTRAEKEEQFRYVDTVVHHVGIGLLSVGPAGEVEIMNNAAKKLLGVPHLRDVRALEPVSRQLVASILTLQSGENALVTVHREGADLQLSLRATQFRMNDRLWTLISLQDIHGELERERMSKELEIARDLQRRLFPANGLSFEGFDVAGVCIPAEEVGGDYYDFLRLEETKLGVVIGDVSGKGVPAAIYMTLTKGVMQAWAARGQSPRVVLDKTNDVMLGTLDKGSFMTMTYAVFDSMEHRCTFARAGHSPPIHYSNASGSIHHIESHGIPLGIRDQATFGSLTDEASVHLERGDLLVFYTDGISEAMNMDREEFGVERLFRSITRHHSGTSHDILTSLQRDVADFVGAMPQHDDMTLVVAKASG